MPDHSIDPLSWTAQQIRVRAMRGAARILDAQACKYDHSPNYNPALAGWLRGRANRLRNRAACLAAYLGFGEPTGE